MVHSWPEFSSPRRFNGDLLILHKPKGNRPQDCAYQMEDEPSFLWWQHVQYLPDARHFCALIEVNRTRILWLVLFRVGRSTPLVKRELGTAAELGTEAEQHCIEDRYASYINVRKYNMYVCIRMYKDRYLFKGTRHETK